MAEEKKKKPPVDYTVFKKDYVLPMEDLSKNQIKTMKISPRDQQGCVLVCTLCCRPLKSAHSARTHVQSKVHIVKVKEEELEQMLSGLPRVLSRRQQDCLTEVLEKVFREQSATAQGQSEAREGIASQLQELLQRTFPDVAVELFGSSASGFALSTSNVNLDLSIPGAQEDQVLIPQVMKKTVEILSANKELYSNVNGDFFAFNKIPRILFQHKASGLLCEIRALTGNPVALTSLLRLYGCIDERVLKLGVLFRYWAKLCRVDIQENGYYPGHMFVVMVIYFLQQRKPPLLPSLHEMAVCGKAESEGSESRHAERGRSQVEEKADDGEIERVDAKGEGSEDAKKRVQRGSRRKMGGGKTTQYVAPPVEHLSDLPEIRRRWQCRNQENLGELWYGLLRYYVMDFNVAEYAVTIRQSQLLRRREREWGSIRLAVEDPLIPRSNLARAACSDRVYTYLITALKQTLLYFSHSTTAVQSKEDCPPENEDVESGDKHVHATPVGSKESVPTCSLANTKPLIDVKRNPSLEIFSDHSPNESEEPSSEQKHRRSVTDDDGSIVFAAFHELESPLPPKKSLDISFQSDSHLSGACYTEIEDSQSTIQPTQPRSSEANQMQLASDIQFGSFELDRKEEEHEEERVQQKSEWGTLVVKVPEDSTQQKPQSPQPLNGCSSPVSSQSNGKRCSPPEPLVPSEGSVSPMCTEKYKEGDQEYVFSAENFSLDLQEYPTACLNCKRAVKHIAKYCPENELPARRAPKTLPSRESLRKIKEIFKRYMKSVMPREQHLQMRQSICDSIQADILQIFPTASVELFGSSANGFGSFLSDLDLCMMLGEEEQEELSKSEVIEAVAAELDKYPGKYQFILPITTARVPIVKFLLVRRRLECDISLENRLALRNTKMLAAYARIDDRVKILGYAVKHFAKVCDMGDASTGSLSSYAYILMLIHYLQKTSPPVVPVLQQLFQDGVTSCTEPTIDSWNCYFYEFSDAQKELAKVWPDYNKNEQSVGELWLGFLRYFATEFDWSKNVVTIRQLQTMTKFDKWWMSKCMCIEDPFNLDHNLGASVSTKMRLYILDRLLAALHYHCKDLQWVDMNFMMDEQILIGDDRPPKFIICLCCNKRGHRAQNCPYKNSGNRRPRAAAIKERMKPKDNPPKEREPAIPTSAAKVSTSRGGILHIKSGRYPSVPTEAENERRSTRRHAANPPAMKPMSNRVHTPRRVHQVPPTGILLPSQYTPLLPTPEVGSHIGRTLLPTPEVGSHIGGTLLPTPEVGSHIEGMSPPGFPVVGGHPSTSINSGVQGGATLYQSGGGMRSRLLTDENQISHRAPVVPLTLPSHSSPVVAYTLASTVHSAQYPSGHSTTVLAPRVYLPARIQYQPSISSTSTFRPPQYVADQTTPTRAPVYPIREPYVQSTAQRFPAPQDIRPPPRPLYRHPNSYRPYNRHEQSYDYGQ